MRLSPHVIPALSALLVAGVAHAQPSPAGQADSAAHAATTIATQSEPGTLSPSDRSFLQQGERGGSFELSMAEVAEQKAVNPRVKQYAQTIVTDHEQLNNSLLHLAHVKGMQLSTQLKPNQQAKLDHLEGLSGAAFDRQYVADETKINRIDKSDLQHEISTTKDPDVRAFAKQMQIADAKHEQIGQELKGQG